jgi:hypothetical protein
MAKWLLAEWLRGDGIDRLAQWKGRELRRWFFKGILHHVEFTNMLIAYS